MHTGEPQQAEHHGRNDEIGADPIPLTDLDRRLLRVLSRDGRTDYPELAHATGRSESTVRRRVEELRQRGILRFDVEITAAALGFSTQAVLWLTVAPGRSADTAAALNTHAEVAFAAGTTGPHNLLVIVVCRTAADLFDYTTIALATIPGIERVETSTITSILKRAAPRTPP